MKRQIIVLFFLLFNALNAQKIELVNPITKPTPVPKAMPKAKPKVVIKEVEKNNDYDGDGITDDFDKCPNSWGTMKNEGCPDSDGDGIADHIDKCPNEKGVLSNYGCVEFKSSSKLIETVSSLPNIIAQLKEGSYSYDAKIEVQGQVIPIEMTRTILLKNNHYIIKDVSKAMMGVSEDEVVLDLTLTPLQRKLIQGDVNIKSIYSKEKCQVSSNMGQNMDITFDKAYLIDGPSLDITLAHFPIIDSFTLICLMPDILIMKNKTISVKYIGLENGLYKVELVNLENEDDKSTFWIDTTIKMARKMEVIMPAMGNAILTIALKQ